MQWTALCDSGVFGNSFCRGPECRGLAPEEDSLTVIRSQSPHRQNQYRRRAGQVSNLGQACPFHFSLVCKFCTCASLRLSTAASERYRHPLPHWNSDHWKPTPMARPHSPTMAGAR